METKTLPCQKEWVKRKKLNAEADKLYAETNELRAKADKLHAEANELRAKSSLLWKLAIDKHYGIVARVKWHRWHPENTKTCHVCGDVYV